MRALLFYVIWICTLGVGFAEGVAMRMQGGLIIVQGTISGGTRPLNLVLDSGAEESVLARRTAEEFGLKLVSRENVRLPDGLTSAFRGPQTTFLVGRRALFTKSPLVLDLRAVSRVVGTRIDGLLGADAFHGRVVKIDYRGRRVALFPTSRPARDAVSLPLSRNYGSFCVSVIVDDISLPKVRLDTGCTLPLCWTLPKGSLLRAPRRDGARRKTNISLGRRRLSNQSTYLYRKPIFPGENGVLGNAVLAKFDRVWIDAVRNRVLLEGS